MNHSSIMVYAFDRCLGKLVEEVVFLDTLSRIYGGAFSPSGRFLYFTVTSADVMGDNIMY